jgi:uncharacterized membrane protein YhfC
MVISGLIAIGLPVFLFVFFRIKYKTPVLPMIIGIIAFVLFSTVLEGLLHQVVIPTFNLRQKPVWFIIYGMFAAGIFEETGRFVSFNVLKKINVKYKNIFTGISYGIGHGGIESILLAGITAVGNVVYCILYNTGNSGILTAKMNAAQVAQFNAGITSLFTMPSATFLVSGIERIFAIGLHIGLSVIVFYAVFGKKKIWLYPLAILLHALGDLPAAALQVNVIKSTVVVEVIAGLSCVVLLVIAYLLHRKYRNELIDGNEFV